jgi:DNA-binding NarL/FixJ family response regulator
MGTLRVLVVDDHESVRKGVRAILGSRPDLEVCAEAANGKEAIGKTMALHPHVVIMDVSMPEMDGISAAREILKVQPSTAIIILSMHDSKQLVENARKIGAHGYVTKGQAGSTLLDAIDAVAQKRDFFPI